MTRTELAIAAAAMLILAWLMGWASARLYQRLTRVSRAEIDELDRMAETLHRAEEMRDQAIADLQRRESELTARLHETEAELTAAMDDLREARAEADDLRRHLSETSLE